MKQRHTAMQIYRRLVEPKGEDTYAGGYDHLRCDAPATDQTVGVQRFVLGDCP